MELSKTVLDKINQDFIMKFEPNKSNGEYCSEFIYGCLYQTKLIMNILNYKWNIETNEFESIFKEN